MAFVINHEAQIREVFEYRHKKFDLCKGSRCEIVSLGEPASMDEVILYTNRKDNGFTFNLSAESSNDWDSDNKQDTDSSTPTSSKTSKKSSAPTKKRSSSRQQVFATSYSHSSEEDNRRVDRQSSKEVESIEI